MCNPSATLHTTYGEIEIELYQKKVPNTVDNFVGLATGKKKWQDPETRKTVEGEPLYNDIDFYRVIEKFIIQTGDPTNKGRGGPGYEFDDEFHEDLRHDDAGILSMANSGPDTNGSQFFITLNAQPHLDEHHSVFGKVTDGMDVVKTISEVPTDKDDKPTSKVKLNSITINDDRNHESGTRIYDPDPDR